MRLCNPNGLSPTCVFRGRVAGPEARRYCRTNDNQIGGRCRMLHLSSHARAALAAAALGVVCLLGPAPARAEDVVRIGLPTKTYYPTIIAETAKRQGLFAKEGITAEL